MAIALNMSHQSWQKKIDKANDGQNSKMTEDKFKTPEKKESHIENYDDFDEDKRKMIAGFKYVFYWNIIIFTSCIFFDYKLINLK